MKLYKRLAVILAGSAMAVGFSSTWAYYSDTQSIVNPFHTTNSSIDMIEDFNQAETILPGETVDKKPYFVNTGDTELVLRLEMDTYWMDKTTEHEAENLKTEMVTLNYPDSFDGDWVEIPEGSGTYYYTHILEGKGKDKSKTSNFLDSLTLKPEVSNDAHAANYSTGRFIVDFNAEAVQADAVSLAVSNWGLTQSEVGADKLEWRNLLPTS